MDTTIPINRKTAWDTLLASVADEFDRNSGVHDDRLSGVTSAYLAAIIRGFLYSDDLGRAELLMRGFYGHAGLSTTDEEAITEARAVYDKMVAHGLTEEATEGVPYGPQVMEVQQACVTRTLIRPPFELDPDEFP